ncbi:MAG TPA: hypothetical protein VI259_19575 [Gemmatimonadaceae bacterium]
MKPRRPAPGRGIVAALLALVALFATSAAPAVASRAAHDDSAVHAAPVLHAPAAQRVSDEQRSQRRVPPAVDLPFVENAQRAVANARASATPARFDRTIVARVVPRAYDATAPPVS